MGEVCEVGGCSLPGAAMQGPSLSQARLGKEPGVTEWGWWECVCVYMRRERETEGTLRAGGATGTQQLN